MAFTTLPVIVRNSVSWPRMAVSDKSGDHSSKEGYESFGNKGIFKSQRKRSLHQDLTVTKVAIGPPPLQVETSGTTGGRRNHVAWTSIPQERWEGELLVQGQIPPWLVCTISLNL